MQTVFIKQKNKKVGGSRKTIHSQVNCIHDIQHAEKIEACSETKEPSVVNPVVELSDDDLTGKQEAVDLGAVLNYLDERITLIDNINMNIKSFNDIIEHNGT